MKILYFKYWTFGRYFRLIMAVLIAFYSIDSKQYFMLIASAWFGAMAIFNVACCGTSGCNTKTENEPLETSSKDLEVKFEEIK
jgi:hypothetical protein